MIRNAIRRGELEPGDTIVEATAGNTGIALAHIAPEWDLHTVIFMYRGSPIKAQRMRDLGARVFELPPVAWDHPDSKFRHCERFRDRMPGRVWFADQYGNPDNALAHHDTAQEIFEQRPDVKGIALAPGTGGTLLGIQQWCEQHRPDVRIAWLDVTADSRSEGVGLATPSPLIRDRIRWDHRFRVRDSEAFGWLQGQEYGPSAAINIAGAIRLAQLIQAPVATVLCDHRSNYDWLK